MPKNFVRYANDAELSLMNLVPTVRRIYRACDSSILVYIEKKENGKKNALLKL